MLDPGRSSQQDFAWPKYVEAFNERPGLLSTEIRELRRARRLPQERMATLAKVSVGSVSDLEPCRFSRPRPSRFNG